MQFYEEHARCFPQSSQLSSELLPIDVENFPASHTVHCFCSWSAANRPAAHAMHTDTELDAEADAARPGVQGVHVAADVAPTACEYVPPLHPKQSSGADDAIWT